MQLTDKQYEAFGTRDVHELFPEHYLIRVEKFPDKVHDAIDEWIYMLKHSEVKPEFTSKHIQDASEKLRIMNLDEAQRRAYDNYIQNVSYKQSMLWSSREEGREVGQQEATLTIARNLLANHVAIEIIATSTGLTVEQITRLQHEKE